MSKYYTELEKLLGVQTLTDNERTALAYGHRKGREDAQPQKIKDLIADRNEWKQQHENLLSVRQSDLQVIAKLEERIRVADAEELVAWGVFGYFDSKWCLQFPVYSDKISASKSVIYTIFADGNNGDWKVEPLYLHAQIPAEVELKEQLDTTPNQKEK